MENNQNIKLSDEIIDRTGLAYKLSKEVVGELNLLDIKENKPKAYDDKQHYLYKIDDGTDILLYPQVNTIFGYINISFSLVHVAYDAIWLIQLLLSDRTIPQMVKPNVIYELKKKKIDVLTLFGMEESETSEVTEFHTKGVLKMFIANIHNFAESAVVDAYGHSKIGYYQHVIKPMLKEHWEELGLSSDFDLITQDQLDEVRKYDLGRKRWFLGDKRQLLNIETLADEADNLRKQFNVARNRCKEIKHSFKMLQRNASQEDQWNKWIEMRTEEFPQLSYAALDSIEEKPPFELAIIHLAYLYGYDEETIRRKITQSRKVRQQKDENG